MNWQKQKWGRSIAFFILLMFVNIAYADEKDITLSFPDDISAGRLSICNKITPSVVTPLEAKGRVNISPDSIVKLSISRNIAGDLKRLPIFPKDIRAIIEFDNFDMTKLDLSPLLVQESLFELEFSHCTSLDPVLYKDILEKLKQVQKISLISCNRLEVFLRAITYLGFLHELNIVTDSLTSVDMHLLSDFKNLISLRLQANNIEGNKLQLDLPNLQEFTCLYRGVEIPSSHQLPILEDLDGLRTPSLKKLHLIRTGVGNKGFSDVKNLINLKEINIDSKRITDAGLYFLANLKNLEHVILNANITGMGISSLPKSVKKLHVFSPSGNDLVTGALDLYALEQLSFTDANGINDDGIANLNTLKNLTYLYINASHVSDEGLLSLAGALPDCHICFSWPNRTVEFFPKSIDEKSKGIGINGYFPLVMGKNIPSFISLSSKDKRMINKYLKTLSEVEIPGIQQPDK